MHHSSSLINAKGLQSKHTPSILLFFSISMAFTAMPSSLRNSISSPTMLAPAMSHHNNDISLRNKVIINKGQRNLRDLTVANVASPSLPVITPPTPEEHGGRHHHHHHVAWTSIPQEKWEGELQVEGEIPLWLVRLHTLQIKLPHIHVFLLHNFKYY